MKLLDYELINSNMVGKTLNQIPSTIRNNSIIKYFHSTDFFTFKQLQKEKPELSQTLNTIPISSVLKRKIGENVCIVLILGTMDSAKDLI